VSISDRREIAFDAAATVVAIGCSQRMVRAIGLPSGTPDGARFDPASGKVILLYRVEEDSFPDHAVPQQAITIQPGPLSALLLSYCMRTGIRIPRHLGRSMRVDRDAVVLLFADSHPVPPATLAPERTGNPAPARSRSWMEMPADTRSRGR
jgi:hypothetical protein